MSKRRTHDAGFKHEEGWKTVRGPVFPTSGAALKAVKGERSLSELAAEYGVHPMMIHQWSAPWSAIGPRTMARALLEGASDIFERGGKMTAEFDEETAWSLRTKIAGRARECRRVERAGERGRRWSSVRLARAPSIRSSPQLAAVLESGHRRSPSSSSAAPAAVVRGRCPAF